MDDSSNVPTGPEAAPPPLLNYGTPRELEIPEGWTGIEVFTLDPARRRQLIILRLGFKIGFDLVVAGGVVAAILWFFPLGRDIRLLMAPVFCVMMAASEISSGVMAVRKMKLLWSGFRMVMADQGLMYVGGGQPKVVVPAAEVARVRDAWDAFHVFLKDGKYVVVSKRMLRVEEVRERLAKWAVIEAGVGLKGTLARIVLVYGVAMISIGSFFGGLSTSDPGIGLICLGVMMGTGLYLWWRTNRIAGLPARVRVMQPIALLIMVLCLVGRIVLAWQRGV